MTYTVRAHGRLQTAEEFGDIVLRSNPRRLGRAHEGRRAHRARRAELSADRPRQRPARRRRRRVPGAGIERARGRARRAQADGRAAARASRTTSTITYTLDTTLPVSEGIKEIVKTLGRSDGARHPRRLPVPPELARDADSDARRAGVADRHVRGVPAARVLDQHAVAVRPRARDRPRRRRCDRRRGGGGASHRRGHEPEGRDAEGDAGSVRPGRSASR